MFGTDCCYEKPRLFNRLTIVLLVIWMLLLTVLIESTERQAVITPESSQSFFKTLIN